MPERPFVFYPPPLWFYYL